MNRHSLCFLAVVATLASVGRLHAAPAKAQPNILLMYVDNVGYGDLGCYGNREVITPRIDRLAREGARCLDFQVVSTSCTPSRGALLTGRHPFRNGLSHQLSPAENRGGVGLPHGERIIPEFLRAVGYATGCFGKWNIGFAPGSRPTERGFDEFLGFRSGNIGYYEHLYGGEYDLFRGIEKFRTEGYSTDLFADETIRFIRRHAVRPWFVYLSFNAAHFVSAGNVAAGEKPSWPAPASAFARYGWSPGEPDERRRYHAVLTALDDAVGRVLDEVDALRLRERTLVMLISDNGAFMLPGRGLEAASNAPLRSGGTTSYEGGTRVPALFRWPGRIPAGCDARAMLTQLDVLPLCLAAAGAPRDTGRVLDGRDPLPALAEGATSPHARMGFGFDKGAAYREGDLKIVREAPDRPWQLFDLAADVGETRDLASERPAEITRLAAGHRAWLEDVRRDSSSPAARP
jgi:arylsulfatase A